jgi:hypothetical protein
MKIEVFDIEMEIPQEIKDKLDYLLEHEEEKEKLSKKERELYRALTNLIINSKIKEI